jgi:predicted signal transduction protein with EAL and GGDEF domain
MVADRLRSLVRDTDVVARMGGDEFAIVQKVVAGPSDATSLAHRMVDLVGRPYDIDGNEVIIGASIGIAMGPADGQCPETLIRNADLSLYQAKGSGRGAFCFFEPEMEARMQTRHELEMDLRNALATGEFELHYQPMVGLNSDDIRGFEALIRWHHPKRGLISPGTFLPLAEDTGLIIAIGEWTIREACATAAKWPGNVRVAVNLSPAQFRSSGLPSLVIGSLAASGLAPERLELEINEMALWNDMHAALDILHRLRALGVRIAMDDFGTGYSSLNYLQSFPFDRIKIDRSFVKDIAGSVGSLKVVRAVATLAQGLGMETTVEGIEDAEQLAAVKSEGCTEMQGFLFSRALPASEVDRIFFSEQSAGELPGSSVAA